MSDCPRDKRVHHFVMQTKGAFDVLPVVPVVYYCHSNLFGGVMESPVVPLEMPRTQSYLP